MIPIARAVISVGRRIAIIAWRRVKLGAGAGGLLVLFGISIGPLIVWASDTASAIVRHRLKL